MSNARSPREVCSTTIGTSGLTVLASFRVRRLNPARRAALAAARSSRRESSSAESAGSSPASRAARPGCSVASSCRSRALRCARSALNVSSRPADFIRSSSFLALVPLLRRRLLERLEHLVLGGLDALGLDDRGEHRLALELALGVDLALVDDLVLAAAGDLQVHLLARSPGARASGASGPTARASGPRRARRAPRSWRSSTAASSTVSRNSASTRACSASVEPLADVVAQLVERVEAGLGGEVVVERRAAPWP